MKQITSNVLIKVLFLLTLLLASTYKVDAQMQMVDDGGGGATIPTAATAFNLTANLDKSSYNAGDSMTLTSLVSMSACLNSASNFLVTGTILDSGNSPTTISDFRSGSRLYGTLTGDYSTQIAGSNISYNPGSSLVGSTSFKAPSVGGDYFIRIDTTYTYLPAKLIIKQTNGISYLYDMSNNIYYATKLPIHYFGTSGRDYEISTDSYGKVLKITDIGGTSNYGTGSDGQAFTDIVAETRTISTYVPFTVNPPPLPPALSVQVFANGKSAETVPYNSTTPITWKTTGNPTSCVCSYSSPATSGSPAKSGSCGTGFNINGNPFAAQGVPAGLTANTTFNVICTDQVISSVPPPADPVYTSTGYVCPSYYPSCFIADTVVQMADGTTKNIQDVKIGDLLKGEKTNNKVLGFHDPKLNDKKLYSFNGGRYFVTAEHPFKTIDGWKSINPALTASENIGITVTELKVGDTLITESGKVLLKTINSKSGEANTQLYNFILDGDHTYYADEYLVHNKMACRDGQVPNLAGGCEGPCAFSCPSGYTKSCNSGSTLCTQDYCGSWVTSYNCTGTVVGSSPQTYEGQSCNQFGTEATCLQGWPTHGCSWNGTTIPDGVCSNAAGSVICTKQKTAATCSAISSCQWVYTNAN